MGVRSTKAFPVFSLVTSTSRNLRSHRSQNQPPPTVAQRTGVQLTSVLALSLIYDIGSELRPTPRGVTKPGQIPLRLGGPPAQVVSLAIQSLMCSDGVSLSTA